MVTLVAFRLFTKNLANSNNTLVDGFIFVTFIYMKQIVWLTKFYFYLKFRLQKEVTYQVTETHEKVSG